MLTSDSILDLIQSFLIFKKRLSIPEPPLSTKEFGKLIPDSLGTVDIWKSVNIALREFLDINCSDINTKVCNMREYAEIIITDWKSGSRNICFMTSGSEDSPKKCIHENKELMEEVKFLKTIFPGIKRVVTAAPAHHCYGFMFGLWLPLFLDIRVKRTSVFPASFFANLTDDALGVGIPLIYEKGIIPHGSARLVCATAPLRNDAFINLESSGYRLTEIFGSSETGVLGYRNKANEPFCLAPYLFKAECKIGRTSTGRLVTIADKLEWLDDRHFIPCGRKDHVVQVGGINVSIGKVERYIRSCPYVKDCTVRLMSPEEGSRLKAFIVPAKKCDEKKLRRALNTWFATLSAEERPQSIKFGPYLPINPMGKLCNWII